MYVFSMFDKCSYHTTMLLRWACQTHDYKNGKFKVTADNPFGYNNKISSGNIENIEGKIDNACSQHFLLFPHLQKTFASGLSNHEIVW